AGQRLADADRVLLGAGLADLAVDGEPARRLLGGEGGVVQGGLRRREEAEQVRHAVERAVDVPDLVGRGVVVDAEAAADDRAPRALGIEREAQARAERLLVVLARPALEERRLPLERVVEP